MPRRQQAVETYSAPCFALKEDAGRCSGCAPQTGVEGRGRTSVCRTRCTWKGTGQLVATRAALMLPQQSHTFSLVSVTEAAAVTPLLGRCCRVCAVGLLLASSRDAALQSACVHTHANTRVHASTMHLHTCQLTYSCAHTCMCLCILCTLCTCTHTV